MVVFRNAEWNWGIALRNLRAVETVLHKILTYSRASFTLQEIIERPQTKRRPRSYGKYIAAGFPEDWEEKNDEQGGRWRTSTQSQSTVHAHRANTMFRKYHFQLINGPISTKRPVLSPSFLLIKNDETIIPCENCDDLQNTAHNLQSLCEITNKTMLAQFLSWELYPMVIWGDSSMLSFSQ